MQMGFTANLAYSEDDDDDDDDAEVLLPPPSSAPDKPTGAAAPRIADDDLQPLFFVPGHRGFYSLRPGTNSPYRLSWYRNVGMLSVMHFASPARAADRPQFVAQ